MKAARLFGASNRLYREFGLSREFTEESLYTLTLEEVRSAIGDEALRQRLEEGETLPFERAVDEGLAIH